MSEKDPTPDLPDPKADKDNQAPISDPVQKNEINPTNQLNPNNKNPQNNTTNMETYHPHKAHQKRKIKDYFFEFLMLFIAITAGFFMENLREHFVERKKEKQFISSMIKDIQADTTSINNILAGNKLQLKGIDSLLDLLEQPFSKMDINKFYRYTNYVNTYSAFSSRDITMIQLKNSGGLRLIENKPVSDSIIIYYSAFDAHKEQYEHNLKSYQEMVKIEMALIDFGIVRNPNKKLTIKNPENLNEFYNSVVLTYLTILSDNDWLNTYKEMGTSLLLFLKQEYKIDNPNE